MKDHFDIHKQVPFLRDMSSIKQRLFVLIPLLKTAFLLSSPSSVAVWTAKLPPAIEPLPTLVKIRIETHPQYCALQLLIDHYQTESRKGDILLTPGKHGAIDAILVARRLMQLRFLSKSTPLDSQLRHILPKTLGTFQKAHQLPPSGQLDQPTLKQLQIPLAVWLKKAQQNLERWTKLQQFDPDHLVVNIPAYRLYAYQQEQEFFSTPVIVGKKDSRTPQFTGEITSIVTHPTWVVPPSFADKLWHYGMKQANGYRIRNGTLIQQPGPNNALGPIKFPLKGFSGILLHSTPNPKDFERTFRALSKGCIRVKDYPKLITYLIKDVSLHKRIFQYLQQKETQQIQLPNPTQIHILYLTLWVTPQGYPLVFPDIYQLERDT